MNDTERIELGKPNDAKKAPPKPDEDAGSRKQDEELLVIGRVMRLPDDLDPPARARVMMYLGSRYGEQEIRRLNPVVDVGAQLRRIITQPD